MAEKKIVLNVDETNLNMADYRRMKWRAKDTTNSVAKMLMAPRVSMIAAIDSEGRNYLSIFHGNTNAQVMEMYFRHLVKKLDGQRPGWRLNTVILCDGATYHTCASTLNLLRDLGVPVIFTGPHSYDASPIELWFSALKAVDLNPRKYGMGKSNFSNVCNAVVKRARAIPRP